MLEQVLDENSPRWITGVKLTRLTMGDKVQHAGPAIDWLDRIFATSYCNFVEGMHDVGPF